MSITDLRPFVELGQNRTGCIIPLLALLYASLSYGGNRPREFFGTLQQPKSAGNNWCPQGPEAKNTVQSFPILTQSKVESDGSSR
jgi:hypothetical protein